ncbi:MAG: hypothetical protein A2231_02940 [Candidatus Firestonebacteria bacterium RIFOXYA2_FULL_40_8]|nr:MAG: hypothetical protein A2231_02940 [Candidatus Firestonebacteria bacterium RIFOXYA2_FULL_40_8]
MTDKLIKFFKRLVLIQVALLALVAGVRYLTPNLYASIYKAHSANKPESFIVKVISINFVKEDNSQVNVWSGTEEIDLMTLTSLSDVRAFNVSVPSGTYRQFSIHFSKDYKIKGSVTIGGSTYYTKAAHTGYSTAPAELETLNIAGQTMDVQSFARDFSPRLTVGSGVALSSVNILIDAEEFLTYWDGSNNGPSGISSAGMCLPSYLPVGIAFNGMPTKQVYRYSSTDGFCSGEGRLTILFDASGNPISGNARPRYINSGDNFNLTGWLMGGTGAVELEYLKKNQDGSIWIKMYDTIAMAYLGQTQNSDYKMIESFQLTAVGASQNGTWKNAAGTTRTFSATRIE